MAKQNNIINLGNPNDPNALNFLIDAQKAQRNQELALLLKKKQIEQGNDLGKTQIIDGIAVRNNPLNGLAYLLQNYNADQNLKNADKALAQQQLRQEQQLYNRFSDTQPQTDNTSGLVQALQNNPNIQSDAIVNPIPETQIQNEAMPAQPSYTPPPTGLNNPFSWQADQAPPAYTGQPITIANNNGSTDNLAGMLRPPVNDIRPLPIENAQPNNGLVQALSNNQNNVQLPQRQVNPFNALGLPQDQAYQLYKSNPEAFIKANLEALSPSGDLKRARELGIGLDEQQRYYRMGANKDINTAILNNGLAPQFDASGQIIGVAPVSGFNASKANQIQSQNNANMPYDAYKAGLEVNKQNSINTNKTQLENQNSFIDTINPVTGNKQSITKEQALQQGGITTGLSEANTELQKNSVKHYNDTIQQGLQARQFLPKVIENLALLNKTPTGQGTIGRNELANKLAVYGIRLPNKNLSNQQLLQASLTFDLFDSLAKNGGARGLTETETKLLQKSIGDLDTDPKAIQSLYYKKIGDLGQNIYNSELSKQNVEKNQGFNKYSDVYSNSSYDKNKFTVVALKSNKQALADFFQTLDRNERARLLKTLQGGK